jgi:hypothetical protein
MGFLIRLFTRCLLPYLKMLCHAEPVCDVSHWDGLQHIDNPEENPFYHVVPDPSDTMVAFGQERTWRYVCERNLEPCPYENRNIDVDLKPEWFYDSVARIYIPPDEIVFRHGGNHRDDGLTEKCLRELNVRIYLLFRRRVFCHIFSPLPPPRSMLRWLYWSPFESLLPQMTCN